MILFDVIPHIFSFSFFRRIDLFNSHKMLYELAVCPRYNHKPGIRVNDTNHQTIYRWDMVHHY